MLYNNAWLLMALRAFLQKQIYVIKSCLNALIIGVEEVEYRLMRIIIDLNHNRMEYI